MNERIITDS